MTAVLNANTLLMLRNTAYQLAVIEVFYVAAIARGSLQYS